MLAPRLWATASPWGMVPVPTEWLKLLQSAQGDGPDRLLNLGTCGGVLVCGRKVDRVWPRAQTIRDLGTALRHIRVLIAADGWDVEAIVLKEKSE